MRNVLARVPKGNAEMVAAAIRTVITPPDAEHVHTQLDIIADMHGRQFVGLESIPHEAETTCWASTDFPVSHWKGKLPAATS